MPHPADRADEVRIVGGRYRLLGEIGRGGRAVVHEAQDPLLGRRVALKVFTASATSPEDVRLQEAEARLVASLDHFALTVLFDAGVDTADPDHPRIYLVMERVPGGDLRRRLREGPLTPAQAMNLGSDLAQGLQAVHEHGFLHRDVKPANVLLARPGPARIRGKLTDFGISSIIGAPDEAGFTTGTAAYLSPEQVEGEDPGPGSDLYALGLVLIESLTGRTAFPGDPESSALARLDRDPELPAELPAPLARVLRAMTERRASSRPTPDEAAVALQDAFLAGLVRGHRVDPEVLADAEPERLAAVRRSGLLDLTGDETLDRVARLARRLLDVPVAIVSVVDAEREWFVSRDGVDVQEVGRSASLAASVVASQAVESAADLTGDPRAAASPLLGEDTGLRAYASAPLTSADGFTIGALTVLDRRERAFTEAERADLADLAAVVMRDLDLRAVGRAVLGR